MPTDIATPMINPGAYAYMERRTGVNGKQQKALAIQTESLKAQLRVNGTARPATVLNCNPVALRLEGGITYKVPSIMDESVPDGQRLKFIYKGKSYKCSVLTIATPFIYPIIVDVALKQGEDPADGVGIYKPLACRPIEIAHNFWTAYNYGAQDSSNMGGVVIYEGDRHALKNAIKGEDVTIHVPTFEKLPTGQREYYCEPKSFMETLAVSLDRQRVYCDNEMQTASIYHNTEAQRNDITQIHRVWHQFALDMGWKEKPEPWLLSQKDFEVSCDGCGAGKKKATAFFCHACARPYVPFEAYKAGELGIESVHLNRCTDTEWAEIRTIEIGRKRRREGLTDEKPEKK